MSIRPGAIQGQGLAEGSDRAGLDGNDFSVADLIAEGQPGIETPRDKLHRHPLSGRKGTIESLGTKPFAALRDVPPNKSEYSVFPAFQRVTVAGTTTTDVRDACQRWGKAGLLETHCGA